jgi:hypothetical protein
MMRRSRTIRPITLLAGSLILGAPGIWIAAGAPGAPASPFGAAAILASGIGETTDGPDHGPRTSDAPAVTLEDVPAGPARTTPPDEVPVVEVAPFTTTAPRGAIDRSLWPTRLAIPSQDVDAPVEPVGVGTGGELIIPPSPMDVGWYQGGSVPGEPGVALLTSHIDTRAEGRGVLAGLVRLSEGDEIRVTAADGTVQRWSVIARTQHRKDELPQELFSRSGEPVLALVTCGGPFDATVRTYRDNVIVWAGPVA